MAVADRETLLFAVKMAKATKRYDDVLKNLHAILRLGGGLSRAEYQLLTLAFKTAIHHRRESYQCIERAEYKECGSSEERAVAKHYMTTIAKEVKDICMPLLRAIDKFLLPKEQNIECLAAYYLLKGDQYRILAEFSVGEPQPKLAESAYKKATLLSVELGPAHPVYLRASLNYAILCNDMLKEPKRACEMARKTIVVADPLFDSLDVELKVESGLLLTVLKHSLEQWSPQIYKYYCGTWIELQSHNTWVPCKEQPSLQ